MEGTLQRVAIADMMKVVTHLAEYTLLDLRFHWCTKVPCVSLRCVPLRCLDYRTCVKNHFLAF